MTVVAAVIHTRYNTIIIIYKEKKSFKTILKMICAYHLHISASFLFLFLYFVVVVVVVIVAIRFWNSFLLLFSQTHLLSLSIYLSFSFILFSIYFAHHFEPKLQQQTLFYCSK